MREPLFASAPGRTWVRLRTLDASCYAENDTGPDPGGLPVFATVLHAHSPEGTALEAEALALTEAVARCVDRSPEQVHVNYALAGAGRQAFGGRLVR